MNQKSVVVGRWILWPVVITLVVALIRLVGELMGWSSFYFSRAGGGGAAPVGIVWLVPIFGIYFAWKLGSAGHGGNAGRTLGMAALGLLTMIVGAVVLYLVASSNEVLSELIFPVVAILAIIVAGRGGSALFSLLLAYGLAVRVFMVIIYFLAFAMHWDSHYTAVSPGFPITSWFGRWVVLGVLPQLTFWVAFTVVFGSLFGGLILLVRRPRPAQPA